MWSAMLLRRVSIRAGFADHLLLTLSMAYVAYRRRGFFRKFQTSRNPSSQANPCDGLQRGDKWP
jgi:hypothetical protein